jgi:hypothetical protein
MAMPNTKPAIQWGILLFVLFYIVHAPDTAAGFVKDAFDVVSSFFHSIGSIITFKSNISG